MTPIAQLIAELREIAAEREFIHLMSWSVLQQKFEAAAEALARQEELLAEAGKVVEPFALAADCFTQDPDGYGVGMEAMETPRRCFAVSPTVGHFRAAARLSDKLKADQ